MRLTVLLSLFLTLHYAAAQQTADFAMEKKTSATNKAFFGVNAGYAITTGEFGSDELGEREAGYAINGFNVSLNYLGYFHKNIAVTFDYGFSSYAFNDEINEENLHRNYPPLVFSINSTNYHHHSITTGISFEFGNNPTSFYLNPVIGFSSLKFPEIDVSATYSNYSGTENHSGPSDSKFIYGINFGFFSEVSPTTMLNINLEYFGLEYEYEGTMIYKDSQGGSETYSNRFDQPYKTLNCSVGLRFML
jgi:hypothetical protein